MTIKRNAAACLKCGDIIESTYTHDFKYCQCKAIFVDGGKDYIRRGGRPQDMKDLTEYEDDKDTPIETKKMDAPGPDFGRAP